MASQRLFKKVDNHSKHLLKPIYTMYLLYLEPGARLRVAARRRAVRPLVLEGTGATRGLLRWPPADLKQYRDLRTAYGSIPET